MMRFVVLAVLVASAYGCGLPTSAPVVSSRVVGGEDARPHSWPWQISLQAEDRGRWMHVCGGSLISNDWVLTAAHCIRDLYVYRVHLGKHCLTEVEEGSLGVKVDKIITHKDYSSLLNRDDIALIKLASPVTFSDTIMPACLPDSGFVLPHAAPCYTTGWGRLSTGGPLATTLQQSLLPVVDHETCGNRSWWGVLATDDMVCAGGDGIVASCNGDSGGPLNCQSADGSWALHGVLSFGPGQSCNVFKKPSVFTQVSSYIDWIDRVMTRN